MNRKDFFKVSALGSASIIMASALSYCSKNNNVSGPGNVDFSINLDEAAYSDLKSAGSSLHKNNIIISHLPSGDYSAVYDVCPHQGCTVGFNGSNSLICPCHGSQFNTDGAFVSGPAGQSLRSYHIALTGSTLRIYS
jgi:cytochrome b6-f complex iron-sulfur subunit